MISASVIAHDRRILPISYTIKITWPVLHSWCNSEQT